MFDTADKSIVDTGMPASSVKDETINQILEVCEAICRGNFEARVLNITTAEGTERRLCHRINEMIDRVDAYVRESTACLGFISRNQYYRRIEEQGWSAVSGSCPRN